MVILIIILIAVAVIPMLQQRERPQIVIVQRERDYDSYGFNPFPIIVIGMIFFLLSTTNVFKNLSTFSLSETNDTTKSRKLLNKQVSTYETISSDEPETSQDTQKAHTTQAQPNYVSPLVREDIKIPQPKRPPYWVVLLKRYRYEDLERFYRLQEHFLNRNIQAIPMSNGEYWAAILVENESQGNAELRDWKRHRSDWASMNLIMEVRDLNNN